MDSLDREILKLELPYDQISDDNYEAIEATDSDTVTLIIDENDLKNIEKMKKSLYPVQISHKRVQDWM
ncbi:hypothetical protein [uncultured Varibaculum sp.]|uniref:hypothetical protein n=1 Tax=uncultured Varibaculum sp. TaxID=413896 RepID=UPI00259270AC|nr:hypothetical protein [uncultured Varibaculum sp.]